MPISTRAGFRDYCLRRLGHPVIEINVDDDQIEDRINDAIQLWQEYHFDGYERAYLKVQVEASKIVLATTNASAYIKDEVVTGGTSGARAIVHAVANDTTLLVKRVDGTFIENEVLIGSQTGATYVTAPTDAFTLGNWDKQYFDVPENVIGIVRTFRIGMGATGMTGNIFDVVYQMRQNDMYNMMNADITYYYQMKQHLSLLDSVFSGERNIRFNRKQNRLFVDVNWYDLMFPGEWIIIEAYVITDPETFTEVYDDLFLKRYATALIKRQWAENMKKFAGIQLPGGVTLNGPALYAEAVEEITKIEEEMQLRYELPVDFMMG